MMKRLSLPLPLPLPSTTLPLLKKILLSIALTFLFFLVVMEDDSGSNSNSNSSKKAYAFQSECNEIGPLTDTQDTPSYYKYSYYYRKQCNYYNDDDNKELYQYWFTVTKIYQYYTKTGSYNSTYQYYSTDQTWILYDKEYNEWLSSGSETYTQTIISQHSKGTDYDGRTNIKKWSDTYTRRYYTYLEYSGSYSYAGCCSATWSQISTNNISWDSLCYPYSRNTQNYFVIDGFPTGNEDGTYYRNDSFHYKTEVELRRNEGCYFYKAYNYSIPSSLKLDKCYSYFTHPKLEEKNVKRYGGNGNPYYYTYYYPTGNTITTDVCTEGDVTVKADAVYGTHDISASIDYVYPISRIWNYANYCYSSPWGNCTHPDDESEYYMYTGYHLPLATALVVPYDPKFLVYPFLSISDLERWSYDKQLSLAVKYLGSQGNTEDDSVIYPDRRALINKNTEETFGYKIYSGYGIPTVDKDNVKQEVDIPIEYKYRNTYCYDSNNIRVSQDNNGYVSKIAVLKSSYFVLDVEFPSKKPSEYVFNFQQYQLADLTLRGYLYTMKGTIAGNDLLEDKKVAEYEYVYPARQFLRIVSLRTVTESKGELIPLTIYKIKVEFLPPNSSEDIDLLSYARMKYNYDIAKINNNTPDPNLVEMIMCVENADNTYKPVNIERYNTNFVSFLDRFYMLRLPDKALQVFKVQNKLQIPLHYALQSLTPQYMKITVQAYPQAEEVTNVYPLPAYQQYTVYQRDIFLGTGIWNDKYVKRYGPNIVIEPPKYFQIYKIDINSEDYGLFTINNCSAGCTIPVGYGRVTGVVKNEWDASGLFSYPAIEQPAIMDDPYIGWTMLGIAVLVGFTVLMLLKYFRREVAEM